MKQYKIVFDRKACIGAYSCAAVAEDIWNFDNKENKVDIKLAGMKGDKEKQEVIIDESMLQKALDSAEVCPVQVIKIIDLETGEEVKRS
ncbi:ferredoxin [Candidatus Woesearchaeota archaeon]|nr:ferredoxin [Candidatus Woesearchaeota archaeon]